MQIAILPGGLATRLGKLTKNEPKSLLKIQGRPFIEYQIEHLRQQNLTNILVYTGHWTAKAAQHYFGGIR